MIAEMAHQRVKKALAQIEFSWGNRDVMNDDTRKK